MSKLCRTVESKFGPVELAFLNASTLVITAWVTPLAVRGFLYSGITQFEIRDAVPSVGYNHFQIAGSELESVENFYPLASPKGSPDKEILEEIVSELTSVAVASMQALYADWLALRHVEAKNLLEKSYKSLATAESVMGMAKQEHANAVKALEQVRNEIAAYSASE